MRQILALVLFATMLTVGCAHKASTNGTPAPPVTPYEQVLADNASLAEANNAIAKSVIILTNKGTMTAAQAIPVLNAQEKIAQADQKLSNILALGPDIAARDAAAIQAAIADITSGATELSGSSAVASDAAHIQSLASSLVSGLRLAGVLK
jgi:hypothetical protein